VPNAGGVVAANDDCAVAPDGRYGISAQAADARVATTTQIDTASTNFFTGPRPLC
jgi:hypothetical protein